MKKAEKTEIICPKCGKAVFRVERREKETAYVQLTPRGTKRCFVKNGGGKVCS